MLAVFLCLGVFVLTFNGCGSGSGGGGSQTTNPLPAVASLSPSSAVVGSAGVTLTIAGSNFLSSSTVTWNGAAVSSTYESASSLTAEIPASDLSSVGTGKIAVVNPAPGGGTSGSLSFTINAAPNPSPTLSSISPMSAYIGISSLTLTLSGSGFVNDSQVLWNGAAMATTYSSATQLEATIPGSDFTSAQQAAVAVFNPTPGGGTSTAQQFTITVAPGSGTVTKVSVVANSLAWDPVNQVIYLSLPSSDGSNGNSVQILNPSNGVLENSASVGSEPNLLSVSENSKYLYVSLDGAASIQRMTLPELGTDIAIPLGSSSSSPYYAMDLQAAPNADTTFAVVRGEKDSIPEETGGVLIYDDSTARPDVLCGWGQQPECTNPNDPNEEWGEYDTIQWNGDGSAMFAANYEDTGYDFYTVPVTSTGFGKVTDYPDLVTGNKAHIHYDKTTGYVYDEDGEVIDPSSGQIVGSFDAAGLMVPDGALGTAFFLIEPAFSGYPYTLESFDMKKFVPIASMPVQNIVGTATHLIRWGTNGLALTTADPYDPSGPGAVYLITGPIVSAPSAGQGRPTGNAALVLQEKK